MPKFYQHFYNMIFKCLRNFSEIFPANKLISRTAWATVTVKKTDTKHYERKLKHLWIYPNPIWNYYFDLIYIVKYIFQLTLFKLDHDTFVVNVTLITWLFIKNTWHIFMVKQSTNHWHTRATFKGTILILRDQYFDTFEPHPPTL